MTKISPELQARIDRVLRMEAAFFDSLDYFSQLEGYGTVEIVDQRKRLLVDQVFEMAAIIRELVKDGPL